MKLIYKEDYKSITKFNDVELENFTVLTGVNGSGKSHLLEAIKNKKLVIDNLDNSHIVLFNFETFRLENEQQYNTTQLAQIRRQKNLLLMDMLNDLRNTINSNTFPHISIMQQTAKDVGKQLQDLNHDDFNLEAFIEGGINFVILEEYENMRKAYNNQLKYIKERDVSVYKVIKDIDVDKLISTPSLDNFQDMIAPFTLKENFLPIQLGQVFWDYYVKYERNSFNEYKKRAFLSEEDFIKYHGNKPWNIVNTILESFKSLGYIVNSPEDENLDFATDSFQLKLKNIKNDVEVNFQDLSSGEKILMALVASIYKTSSDNAFPDILLLDEIDASLHPSMIKNLLDVIKDVFLANGMKVVMVTHSPSTIALAPEESIFVMNKEGENRIEKSSKEEALDILTEGFATLEKGLKLFDEIAKQKLTLITEGKNTEFIKKACKLYSVTDVHIITGAESKSGESQLKTLYDFFTKIPHDNKVLFVWDCDVKKYRDLVAENSTYSYVFDKHTENNIAKKGIENLFDENHFNTRFIKEIKVGGETRERIFADDKKNEFMEYILDRNNKDDFKNFEPLFKKIEALK
jgi:energy-coupling factor transporter ATP-binding protein EcfA2